MTKTNEEYSTLATEIQQVIDYLDKNLKFVEQHEKLALRIENRIRENVKSKTPILMEEILMLAFHNRQNIIGHKVTVSMLALILAYISKLFFLAEENNGVKLEVPKNIEKQLTMWTEHMEKAAKAQSEYVK